jgi:hypothetical protein
MFRTAWMSLTVCLLACDSAGDTSAVSDAMAGAGGARGAGSAGRAASASSRDAGGPWSPGSDAGAADDDAGAQSSPAACGAGECDVLDPLSCGETDGCLWLLGDDEEASAQCLPVGEGADGSACDDGRDCAPGLDCTAFDGSGSCRRYCCELNATAGCPAGQYCRVALGDVGGLDAPALCDACDGCDLTADDGSCGAAMGCYALPGEAPCRACLPAGAARPVAPCDRANDCVSGSGCFAIEGTRRCHAFCRLDGADDACENGECTPTDGAMLPEGIGLCL